MLVLFVIEVFSDYQMSVHLRDTLQFVSLVVKDLLNYLI